MEKKSGSVYYCIVKDYCAEKESYFARKMLKYAFLDFFQLGLQEEEIGRLENGKPYYRKDNRLHFNVSHCQSAIAVAVSYVPIGIDVEGMREVNERTVRKCCGKEEIAYVFEARGKEQNAKGILSKEETQRFLKLWTLKESYVKMTGEGLRKPLDEVCFRLENIKERKGTSVFEVKGEVPLALHYLYMPKEHSLALTVKWQDFPPEPDFAWRECALDEFF